MLQPVAQISCLSAHVTGLANRFDNAGFIHRFI